MPNQIPEVTKIHHILDTISGANFGYKKLVYKLIQPGQYPYLVLVHYLGDEKLSVPFPHRTKKDQNGNVYKREVPSKLHTFMGMCSVKNAHSAYKEAVSTGLEPRNKKQFRNLKDFLNKNRRIGLDEIYNVHTLAVELECISAINTYPNL